jgi:MEDS: MEthanogen/methylotroph, DcmR Sensory domain
MALEVGIIFRAMRADRPADLAGHFHAVRFFKDDDSLCRIVGSFLIEGLTKAEPAVVIATPEHTTAIEECLRKASLDVVDLKRLGELITLDARKMLATFMADGVPNPGAFRDHIGGVITQVARGREQCTIRAYGEMVDLLWRDGLTAAAIQVETLWNQLARAHDFKLLCGYSMGNFYKGSAFDDIKGQHSHLTSDAGEHVPLH